MSEPAPGIHAERSQRADGGKVWHWLTGDTYPHREMLKRHGARFSSRRRAWYLIGDRLPAAIQALVAIDGAQQSAPQPEPTLSPELERQILAVLAADDAREQAGRIVEPKTEAEVKEPPEKSQIRISKPAPLSADGELDAVPAAIRDMKPQPLQASAALVINGRIAHIGQAFCGEITGSITGQIFCYGYAVHDGIAVYINMAGPRMAVEAIRAKLSKGEHVMVVPPDAPSVELAAGEGNTGMYHAYLHYLPEARFASLILVHEWAATPNYSGKATTFIFRTSDAQAAAKLKHHVTQLVNIPVFDAWSAYLYDAGQRAMLVRKTRSAGGIDLLSVDLDVDAWTRLITGGLQQGVISLSGHTT